MVTRQSLNRIRLFYAAYFAAMGLILPFFPIYLDDKGFDVAMIGVITGLIALAKVVAPPWVGHLLDSQSATRTHQFIIIASSMAAICALFFGLFDNIYLFALMVFLFGVFWASVLPLTDGLSISIAESQAADYGRLRVWGSVGFIITSMAGGWWLVGAYIDTFPLALAALMFISVFAALGFPKLQTAAPHVSQHVAFSKTFYIVLAIAFIMQVSHGAYYGFFSLYLTAAGFSGSQIGLYWVIGVVAEIFLMWRWTQPLQQANPAIVFILCLLLASLRWVGIGMSTDVILLALFQLLHAASFAAFHVTAIAWVKRLAPDPRHAAAQGLYSAAGFGLGSSIGIMGCGLIVSLFSYNMAFYLCAIISLLAIPLTYGLKHLKTT